MDEEEKRHVLERVRQMLDDDGPGGNMTGLIMVALNLHFNYPVETDLIIRKIYREREAKDKAEKENIISPNSGQVIVPPEVYDHPTATQEEKEAKKARVEKLERKYAMMGFFKRLNKDLGNRPPGRQPGAKKEAPKAMSEDPQSISGQG